MKKILTVFFITTFIIIIFTKKDKSLPLSIPQTSPPIKISTIDKLDTIFYNNEIYPFAYFIVDHPKDLSLSLNLFQMDSSIDIIKEKSCSFLTNGGFYDKNNQPLGWFVEDGQEISKKITSNLFNGFLQKKHNQIFITQTPLSNVDFGLQSGPLLIKNSKILTLKIKNDESRRRIIATLNQTNQLIFIVIISKESEFNGPLLAETPSLLGKISQKINQKLVSAINLDGGSASTFFTKDIHLKEFSHIGSYFCL